jgi:PPOX class probable F420-dependent enzyme
MSRRMDPEEIREFLLAGNRTAMIATVRRDGRPHVSPVWFTLDGDDVVFVAPADAVKVRILRRDPRISVGVDRADHPPAFVGIDGVATIVEDAAVAAEWLERIAARYVPPGEPSHPDEPDPYYRKVGVLVRVRAEHVLAINYDA